MKRKISLVSVALQLGFAISCSDSFLNTRPYGAVTQQLLNANESGASTLLIAAYSNLDGFSGWDNGNPWGGAGSNWTWGSVAGGDAYKGSEANDQPDVTPIELHLTVPNNPYLEGKWRNYYDGIQRANKAILAYSALDAAVITDTRRNTALGEAKFLRAFYHLDLYKVFQNVPYITEDLADVRIGNTNAAGEYIDILPSIVADLEDAVAKLPATQSDPGRAKKTTAQAYLGYVKLWQKDYAGAKAQFDAVVNSGLYSLNANYHDNFNPAFRNTAEGILEVQQSVNDGTTDNGNNGDVLNFPYGGGPGGCCGFHQPSQNLVNAFKVDATTGLPDWDNFDSTGDVTSDEGLAGSDPFTPYAGTVDPRLDWTVGRRGIPYLDWGKHPGVAWTRAQNYGGPYSPKKNVYYLSQENTFTAASGWTKGYNSNNTKLMRYADLLLLLAECEVELNNLATATSLVNQVRNRAKNGSKVMDGAVPAANYKVEPYPATFANQTDARKAVQYERRIELGMEGHRFFDLVRWGIAAQVKNAYFASEGLKRGYLKNGSFVAGKSERSPIPQGAINASSKDSKATLKQNPGYAN